MSDIAKRIDAFVESIGEHCHSIRVIAVIPNGKKETQIYTCGDGDSYSQLGAVREWIIRQDEATRIDARKDGEDDIAGA